MALDKLPEGITNVFSQRDVRETPAATATATSVGLTDPHYLTLQVDADLTNERVLTAGEGIDFTDNGAGGTLVINGESATTTGNKGICSFNSTDFSVTAGAVSLADTVVISVDGDAGTATPSLNNLDILGGEGITTAGSGNDITISGEDSAVGNKGIVIVAGGEGIDVAYDTGTATISGENATTTNKGITEYSTIAETQTGTSETTAVTPNSLFEVLPPVGAIIAWAKSMTSVPQTLPVGWVECDGATISDAESPMNGVALPDLNGGEFLEGRATSGATGGSATMAHTHTGPSHTHGMGIYDNPTIRFKAGGTHGTGTSVVTDTVSTGSASEADESDEWITGTGGTGNSGAASETENRPPFYTVVWIMRIK